jgi:hypothetical protein
MMSAIDDKTDELIYKLINQIFTSSVAYQKDLVLADIVYLQLQRELQHHKDCPPIRRLQDYVVEVIDIYKASDKYWWAVHNATKTKDFNEYDLYGKII